MKRYDFSHSDSHADLTGAAPSQKMPNEPCSECHGEGEKEYFPEDSPVNPIISVCDQCKGSGIEPKVELISAEDRAKEFYELFNVANLFDMHEHVIELMQVTIDNAREFGKQEGREEQREEDANIVLEQFKPIIESRCKTSEISPIDFYNVTEGILKQAAKAIREGGRNDTATDTTAG